MASLKSNVKTYILTHIPGISSYRFKIAAFYKKALWPLRYLPGNSRYFGPPRGIYPDAQSYNQANPQTPIMELMLKESVPHTRKLPGSNSKLVIDKFKSCLNVAMVEKKAWFLKKARYINEYGGTVITSDDKIFFPCSPLKNEHNYEKHQSLYLFSLPKITKFEKVVLIDTRVADDNYYHWIRDHLSRFFWLKQLNLDLSEYTLVATNGTADYNAEANQLLKDNGFNFKEWIQKKEVKHFYADELIIPPYANKGLNSDKFTFDIAEAVFLKDLLLPQKAGVITTYDKIYLSRRKSSRSSPQETELIEKLTQYNFKEIFLEDYTLSEQALLFNKAAVIIGFHGAGFTNLFFCNPDVKVIEIFGPDFIVTDYWSIADKLNIDYYAYCDDEYHKNITPYRIARLAPTLMDTTNFMQLLNSSALL